MLITISRQYGAGGSEVARRVADALGWKVVDNELVEQVAARAGLPPQEVAAREERVPGFVERLARALVVATPEVVPPPGVPIPDLEEADLVRITEAVVNEVAAQGRVVLVGRAAPAVLARQQDALHVRLVAPKPFRLVHAAERLGLEVDAIGRILEETDAQRERYHREYYGRDWSDPVNYHLTINTAALGFDGATGVVVAQARAMGW